MLESPQKALARRSGLSPDYIRRLEQGKSNPTLETLAKLGAGLDRSMAALILDNYDDADELAELIRDLPEPERQLAAPWSARSGSTSPCGARGASPAAS